MKELNTQEINLVQGGFALVGWGAYGGVNWNDDILAAQARARAVQEFLAANPWASYADVPAAGGSFN